MICWLESLTRHDAPRYGGKAATLGELVAMGLPVPGGFVVAPEAYDAFVSSVPDLAAWLDGADAWPDPEVEAIATSQFLGAPMPPTVEQAVREAYAELERRVGMAQPPVAVRSSARGEDGEAASFAGQQVTYLNAVGPDLVLGALRGCWAGLWSARASAYRRKLAADGAPGMAVLVQLLVLPEAAGVAFTVNPVTGDRQELLIDASWGLGEVVVSGRATPDHVRVDKPTGAVKAYTVGAKEVSMVPDPRGIVPRENPRELAARRALEAEAIAALMALAQDVETRFGGPQDIEWAWRDGRMYLLQARPITALPPPPPPGGWVGPEPGVWERRNFAEHLPGPVSRLTETLVLPVVGRAVSGLARSIGFSLADPVFATIHGYAYARGTLVPRWDMGARSAWVYGRLFLEKPARWQWSGAYEQRLAPYLGRLPDARDAGAIARWCEGLVTEFARAWQDLHRLSGAWRWSEVALNYLLQGPTGPLLQGFDAPALALDREAYRLAHHPDAAGLERLAARARDMVASFDLADPLPYGSTEAVRALVAGRGDGPDPAERLEALVREREAATVGVLATTPGWRGLALKLALPWARGFAAQREPALAELGRGWGVLREQLLSLGRLFAERGELQTPEQVFALDWAEVKAMAAGAAGPGIAAVEAREAARRAALGLTPPLIIGGEAMRVYARAGAIAGAPGSPGRVTGIARVVRGPHEFASLAPGEILVAPVTTPAWTPLFHRAAAVVTDVGGPLSHGSIVAREFRIPAVLGTETATQRLRSGDTVTVDGDLGLVWKS